MNTNLTPVSSSQIAAVGYEELTLTMTVKFTNGNVYEYANVPKELFDKMMAAKSVGSFFSAEIKSKPETYPYDKIENV